MEVPRFLSEIFPQDQTDLSWVPDGMDPNSSYRLAVRVGAYVKLTDDGNRVYCDAYNIPKVLDRDRTNWKDLVVDIATKINLGPNNKLRVTYWDKINRSYEEVSSDQKLIDAIDMYWEIRRLSLQVCVMKKDDSDSVHEIGRKQNMPCVLQGSTETSDAQIIAVPSSETAPSLLEPLVQESVEVAWVDDDVEYVGLDDEYPFKTLLSDSECDGLDDVLECVDLEDDVECVGLDDELVVDDALGCETFIHATDLENPTIAVGVTFGDGDTFKKAIRQYAIKGEFEIAAPYSESSRYRGYCKAERCKWRIHASRLQDERTWKIKKIPYPHTCQSTGKVEKNSMASNHWVRDRVLDWLAKDSTIGAKALKTRLEEQYHLQLSYLCVMGLHQAIGSPRGLVISTDAGKGIDSAVTHIFKNGVEHRECMRHLVANFQKQYRGEVFEKHLWPACRAYQIHRFEEHYNLMYEACPEAMKWIHDNHKHLWTRHLFSEASKCDYVTNNIAETFNSWIRNEKSLHVVDLMDRIRQLCMQKMFLRSKIAMKLKDKILPNVMKDLFARSRGLKYIWRYSHKEGGKEGEMLGEVEGVTKNLVHWRHTVDLHEGKCTCRRWQITGLPCTHALCIITSIRGYNIEDYVHEYYYVAKFKKAYGKSVKPMTDRKQWPQVNPGFKLWPPILKRAAGRPRVRRYKSVAEGGSGKRTTRCKRCKQLGHMEKTCNEYVYESDAPPPAPPKPKRKRGKKNVTVVPSSTAEPTQQQPSFSNPFATPSRAISTVSTPSPVTRSMSRKMLEYDLSTPTRAMTLVSTPSPVTRSRKRILELEDTIEPVQCLALSPVPINDKEKPKKLKVVRFKKT